MNSENAGILKKQAKIVSEVLKHLAQAVKPGVTTEQLDKLAEEKIKLLGAEPYNKNYKPHWASKPFPAIICTSVNEEIAHGIPSSRVLKDGDIISLDVGIKYEGLCGDAALTVPVGQIDNKKQRLLYYARNALEVGIQAIRPHCTIGEISRAIELYSVRRGYVVNRTFSGHGIGKEMHENPPIPHTTDFPNISKKYFAEVLKPGQVICLEPMLTFKDAVGKLQDNAWTVATEDKQPSAFFEHMILLTETGYEILTTHI